MKNWDRPHYFRVRLVKQGPPCGLKIWYGQPLDPIDGSVLDRSYRWQVWLNGELCDDPTQFILHFEPDGTPIIKGEIIDETEFLYLTALQRHATTYDDTMPEANPRKPVNLRQMAPVLPPK